MSAVHIGVGKRSLIKTPEVPTSDNGTLSITVDSIALPASALAFTVELTREGQNENDDVLY